MAIVVGLSLAELAYRAKLYFQIGHTPLGVAATYHAWNRATTRFDRQKGFTHVPDQAVVGVRVTEGRAVLQLERATNENGNVGLAETGYSSAAIKVLVVGDSFSASQRRGVTWPGLLQKELSERLEKETVVLNGARSGHGLLQMFDVASLLATEMKPDLVVVAFIADDLNRSRFWQEVRQIDGESRLVTSLVPGGQGWVALGEMFEPRIDEEWCRRVVEKGGTDDPLLKDLNERFQRRKRDNPSRIDYAALTSSFLYNRLVHGDPFFDVVGKAATPRFSWRDFRRDDAMIRAIEELKSLPVTMVLVQLPEFEDFEAAAYQMTGQQRALRTSLETLTGLPVNNLIDRGSRQRQPRSLFLLPHDRHPSWEGLGWYARTIAVLLTDTLFTHSDDDVRKESDDE